MYKHTQIGVTILVVLALVAILIIVMSTLVGKEAPIWIPIAIVGFLVVIALLFGTLTVEIQDGKLRCWFGFGIIHKEFNLAEVTTVKLVKNPWFYGWGIRRTPEAWMFNVSGLDAVQIEFVSGKKFRIGTDQPRRLEAAINQNIQQN